jgi:hypothetical protein
MATNSYSSLVNSTAAWNSAVRHFGITTVMNAKVYDIIEGKDITAFFTAVGKTAEQVYTLFGADKDEKNPFVTRAGEQGSYTYAFNNENIKFSKLKVNEIVALYLMTTPVTQLKYLKTANVTQEGPTKTVTGGQNASPLIKYGKTSRLEIQDALGNAEAMEALMGTVTEYFRVNKATESTLETGASDVIHAASTFAGPKAILGETFIIDSKTAAQVPCYIIFYDFLPDSLFNLTQDAEGDATVFDMNGDLIQTNILIGDNHFKLVEADPEGPEEDHYEADEDGIVVGVFDSIIPKLDYAANPLQIVKQD